MKKLIFTLLAFLFSLLHVSAQIADAKWIGTTEPVLFSHYLPIFRYHCTLQLHRPSHSTTASVLLGGNDTRLMNRNLNIQGVQMQRDSSYLRVEYDIAPMKDGKSAQLHVYRAGYTQSDNPSNPLHTFAIPAELLTEDGYAPVRLQIEVTASTLHLHVNEHRLGSIAVNPHGPSHDFIGYPQLADIGYAMRAGQRAILSDVRITHHRSPQGILYSEPSPRRIGGNNQVFHLYDPSHGGMPTLQASFKLKQKPISSAILTATSRGIYEAQLNGCKIGTEWYAPGLSQYNRTHYYQTYAIDSLLKSGTNHIRVQLAEGWWMGYVTYDMTHWNFFSDRLAFKCRLVVRYEDGDSTVLTTQPRQWQVSTDGPIRYASLFMGQVTDARYRHSRWRPAEEILLTDRLPVEGGGSTPKVNDYAQQQFLPSASSVQAFTTLKAKEITEPRPGVYVYDMAQNMAGVPRIHLPALPKGTQVRLRFAEVVYPGLPAYQSHTGMLMLENIRAALSQDLFISDGKPFVLEPRFTQHGYRYIEITGLPAPLPVDSVESVVLSSVHAFASHFQCSNPLVNRLWENIRWSTLANFISIPTDCPQRNERMGWGGDISVFSRTATFLTDCKSFLSKHLQAMRDIQQPDGRFPDVAPIGGGFGGFLWGAAGITVPWELWLHYADREILSEHYPAMLRYMDYVERHYIDPSTNLFVQNNNESKLGDWLGLQDNQNDKSLLFECYYIYALTIMQKTAHLLGRTSDVQRFANTLSQRREHFARTYLHPQTARTVSSAFMGNRKGDLVDIQGSYVLPLAFDVVEDSLKEKLFQHLVQTIERSNTTDDKQTTPPYSLLTGFITTSWISRVLTDYGRPDVAYRLLQHTGYPSWLYPVTQGATTIWERLNSYTHSHGFGGNNSMNSFNHYSFGAVGQWLINRCLGIERDEEHPGFRHFYLCPVPDPTGQMTHASGHYDSPFGRIESSWHRQSDGTFRYRFTVPQGTTATLLLPGRPAQELHPGAYQF